MKKLPLLILKKNRLRTIIDFLNELASGTSSDQSQVKIDLVEELERLMAQMEKLENEISNVQITRSTNRADTD